jgi:hypothetical protein
MMWMRRVAPLLCLAALAGCSYPGGGTSEVGQTPTVKEATPVQPAFVKPPGTAEERIKRANEFAAKGDYAKAMAQAEEALLVENKNREAFFLTSKYAHARYPEVAGKDPKEAYIMARKAADYIRLIHSNYPELTPREKQLASEVFIVEATELAFCKQDFYISGSFHDAVDHGFRDFDRLRTDPKWQGILEYDWFRKDFENTAKQYSKPAEAGATGSQGSKPADAKGSKPADAKGSKPADARGNESSGPR